VRRRLVALLGPMLVLAVAACAHGQTLALGVSGSLNGPGTGASPAAARVSVRVLGARAGDARVDLGLAFDGSAQLDFGVQANTTFGPLGNLIGEGGVSLRTDAQAQGELAVRGVLGPLALGVRLSAFTGDPQRFDPLALAGDARPDFGGGGLGASLDVSGRASRDVVLQASPEVYLVAAGTAARLNARVRFLRAIGRNELSLRALGYATPHLAAIDAALGVGLTVKRREAPDLDGAVYLGWSPRGPSPGATVGLGQQLGPVSASLSLEAQPFRLDVPPYRASLGLDVDLGPGQVHVRGVAAAGPAGRAASLGISYQLPVTFPE